MRKIPLSEAQNAPETLGPMAAFRHRPRLLDLSCSQPEIGFPQARAETAHDLRGIAESPVNLKAALSRLPLPVLIVDAGGGVSTVNGSARRILDQRDGLIHARGLLETTSPEVTKRLRAIVRSALLTPAAPWRIASTLAVARPSGRQPLVLVVEPLRTCTADCVAACGRALVVIHELEWRRTESAALLQQAFGLTPAETEVTTSLLKGKSLAEIAGGRSVRLSTIRSQIKSVFAKTGVNRQIDLVRLIARLPDLGA